MTEQEMDRLAELIVDKLIIKQAAYDAKFMEELAKNAGPDYDITIDYHTAKSVDEQIKELESQIDRCIKTDNFEAIKDLQDQINKLLNNGQ
jgi:L-alanine-DL-glutamate epimerase-like enolase superfamily enzyme